jgi:N-acetyl-anhydromuramyl-L-alanine amidase AmpD
VSFVNGIKFVALIEQSVSDLTISNLEEGDRVCEVSPIKSLFTLGSFMKSLGYFSEIKVIHQMQKKCVAIFRVIFANTSGHPDLSTCQTSQNACFGYLF